MKTETPPTIAELWGEFIGLDKVNRHYMSHPQYATARIERHKALREQLLERCEPWITWHRNGSINARITFVPSNTDVATLRKCAAICEFAAWEIEQRQRERETQNEH